MNRLKILSVFLIVFLSLSCNSPKQLSTKPSFSGIYPHLASYNDEGECGTGAVVPWADRLWTITYSPHMPFGSTSKLYEITENLEMTIRPESTGGTPANRMIHKESNQLFLGPYAIDTARNVRVISYKDAPGRYTGTARHLTDPANKLYIATMEEGFYEVNVHNLAINTLYTDGNVIEKKIEGKSAQFNSLLPGCHGKGLYSGQGVLVYSNNGEDAKEARKKFDIESGVLAEWDGKDWKVIYRNQFTEVTGPGGIYGNPNPATDPIWALGWDHKSVILALHHNNTWTSYRLPKASYSYDGAHGWNTEWPRIRDIGTSEKPDYLMNMHGMFWRFPATFTSNNTAGIRPRSAYLKVIGDFSRWNDQLVFGCDDSAQKEFLNKRKVKGNIEGSGQSNSNLWFTSIEQPDNLGTTTSSGYVWLKEDVMANVASEPFIFTGWKNRCAWIKNNSESAVVFTFEVDKQGNNQWTHLKSIELPALSSRFIAFNDAEQGEWIRVQTNKDTKASLSFNYSSDEKRNNKVNPMFAGLTTVNSLETQGGLLYGLGKNRRVLGVLANNNGQETGYYELDEQMNLIPKEDKGTADFIRDKFAIPQQVVEIDESSVLVVDDKGRRWRFPLGDKRYDELTNDGKLRICREVATERDLFSCHGTFYELPAENADGFAKVRPVSSHNLAINDFASYRGLLIMTGISHKDAKKNNHIIVSEDKKASVWAGTIDDLWKLGKPVGKGGPWSNASVSANTPSDPYLIGFYDHKTLTLSHQSEQTVQITVEVDPTGDGDWFRYKTFNVEKGKPLTHIFPKSFHARWIRFVSDTSTTVIAWLEYK